MEIKINIEAPGLEKAIHALSQALGGSAPQPRTKQVDVVKNSKEGGVKETVVPDTPEDEPKEETNNITLETVRKKLADLAQRGKQKEVKTLITSLGAKKLSDVPEERYPELLERAAAV